jgi:hypothetical protein
MLNIISSVIYKLTNDDNFSPADNFLNPKESAQKRYEALRAYFLESLTQKLQINGEVVGEEIIIKMNKKATTPVFKSNEIFPKSYPIPWLVNKRLQFDWIS